VRLADAFGDATAPNLRSELVSSIVEAPERMRTLRGTIRDWTNNRLVAHSLGNTWDPGPAEVDTTIWRVWFELPTSLFDDLETPRRVRVENVRGGGLHHLAVRDGDRWWAWSRGRLISSHEHGSPSDLKDLWLHVIAPTWAFSKTVVEIGEQKWLGRDALELYDPEGTSFLGPQADSARYLIDAERGAALRAEAFVGGESASVEEFIDIAFDQVFDPALFDGAAAVRAGTLLPLLMVR
jgi:hypothetical protein